MTDNAAVGGGAAGRLELCAVMPVYNEEEIVGEVAESWLEVLDSLGVDYELVAIVDGATDASEQVLRAVAERHPRLVVDVKPNSGHGPTILRGYRRAVVTADWVFQTDSDDEMPAASFSDLWELRHQADAVIGIRTSRNQAPGRRAITRAARFTARVAFGCRLADVNCPYRLMRSTALAPLLAPIPDDTFAPNVAISGMLSRSGVRLAEVPVPHHDRTTGVVSILGRRALRAALRSFAQTVRLSRTRVLAD
ncbi:MAG: glycosyltransferase family 2 protein [Acidimicrobiia bacterium]|nr:glycosyltransferase family 2 protein [Acidimicrobiia bacterium]MYG57412.1 glycosyltransferase family 2 protein [Acidimicrobiia bacterium]MYH95007.1 glycosyltransferase family 2 protein [Acidimicrobiia bacterium]MYJ31829.1 glycosyltransferase family 2 protein [Acidimicrobiia bacterium]